jgi:hypothetical protein
MTTRQAIDQLLQDLPDEQLGEVLAFARYVIWREQREPWLRFGRDHLAKAYGENEPDYAIEDIKPEPAA